MDHDSYTTELSIPLEPIYKLGAISAPRQGRQPNRSGGKHRVQTQIVPNENLHLWLKTLSPSSANDAGETLLVEPTTDVSSPKFFSMLRSVLNGF